ncbi:hypothetical protein AURDEDRAFT_124426 [Auricularia subglabra TFB-10046 SS5]|nr:hypothetical protein AURDEDRAFT_124426 [Auricularia subglabra TFB-10046 SS5]
MQQDSVVNNWTMPQDLKDNIGMFTYAVLMSARLTTYRNKLTPTILIILSIKGKWHITKLATQLLAKAPDLKMTSALLTRLAFIRFQYANASTKQIKGDGFWPHVSDKLEETTTSAPNAIALSQLLKEYLDDDEALYTNGPKKKPTIAALNELGDMQNLVDEHAALIEVGTAEFDEEIDDEEIEDAGSA